MIVDFFSAANWFVSTRFKRLNSLRTQLLACVSPFYALFLHVTLAATGHREPSISITESMHASNLYFVLLGSYECNLYRKTYQDKTVCGKLKAIERLLVVFAKASHLTAKCIGIVYERLFVHVLVRLITMHLIGFCLRSKYINFWFMRFH